MEYEKLQDGKKKSWKRRVFKNKGAAPENEETTKSASKRKEKATAKKEKQEIDRPVDGGTLQPLQEETRNEQESSQKTPTSSILRGRSDRKSKSHIALSREFGRASLPTKIARNWVVEISPAEWESEENQWKYRILVQRRNLSSTRSQKASSFTNAFTWRSLSDFCWLEEALRAEYHGALMLPLLSIAISTSDLANAQNEVDAELLQNWLGDVFNGIRGAGEVVLDMKPVDIISSEAMEAFLYRNTDPLPRIDPRGEILTNAKFGLPSPSTMDLPWKENGDNSSWKDSAEEADPSIVDSLFIKPFSWLQLDSVCGGGTSQTIDEKEPPTRGSNHVPLAIISCSSRAVGDSATLEMKDSFVEFSAQHKQQDSSQLAIHSEILEAEKELVSSYRQSALSCTEKLRVLSEEETQIGAAWKRFAIALANLFAIEKEIETTRIGVKENKEHMPYRKLRKKDIEDRLRIMARQKMDRSIPSLRALGAMLAAYVGDLSSVDPAITAYSRAVVHLSGLDDAVASASRQQRNHSSSNCGGQWQEQLKALASLQFGEVTKQFSGNSGTSQRTDSTEASSMDAEIVASQQKRAFEERVLSNERLLRQFVTVLCKAAPLRSARMAWKYFKMESAQAALLKGSSISMRTKANVASSKSISEMTKRHEKGDFQDDLAELELVQRIVDIGSSSKRYKSNPQQSSVSGSESEASSEYDVDEDENEEEMEVLRSRAIEFARDRPGLWNAKLALSIMEAVGISNAEVRVEETTRELRLVRQHAIGLRENLDRCVEAVELLCSVILEVDPGAPDAYSRQSKAEREGSRIHDTRRTFMSEISSLFSGTSLHNESGKTPSKSSFPSVRVLTGAGIDTSDPAGWRTGSDGFEHKNWKNSTSRGRGRCGEAAMSYTLRMDTGVDILLQRIAELLKDYERRVAGIESFVYMHCVGIQLEKHFSQKRSEALAAWEKKTDITTAINIATRKGLPVLVTELQAKLDNLSPRNVSHTTVKETKEMHLASKALKTELHDLANRRFLRARENATCRVVELMTLWAKYEEGAASEELNALGDAMDEIEKTLDNGTIPSYLLEKAK